MDIYKMKDFFGSDWLNFSAVGVDYDLLSQKTRNFLLEVGVPSKIDWQKYEAVTGKKILLDRYLIILQGLTENNWFIGIDVESDESVYIISEFESKTTTAFFNSGLEKFVECLYTFERHIKERVKPEVLGKYYENDNFEKYAAILKKELYEIDPICVEKGVWERIIEERELGVM